MTAPLVDALARCITRHQIGSTEPVQPPAWITVAATEIAAAIDAISWTTGCEEIMCDGPFIDINDLAPELDINDLAPELDKEAT